MKTLKTLLLVFAAQSLLSASGHSATALIVSGSNAGTNSLADGESHDPDWYPATYNLTVNTFYMDKYPVTKALWDEVYDWAISNGYSFDNIGGGKDADHPVHTVNWHDALKWCNARSEREDLPPVYTVNESVYRSGRSNNVVQTSAAGYRLPTDAEWEYAARGGLTSRNFPWGNEIRHSRANYYSALSYGYDTSGTQGYHPSHDAGGAPYTSPVGSFEANAFGLHDMAGNVWEWCFDSHPSNPWRRIGRGGSWVSHAIGCRLGYRYPLSPNSAGHHVGFRTVRSTGKQDQTIAFAPIPDQIATNVLELAATADSGLPVSFTVSPDTVVTADATTLSFVGSGYVTVTAEQPGDDTWNAAPPVSHTFAVLTEEGFVDANGNNVCDDWEALHWPGGDAPATVTIRGIEMTLREVFVAGLDPFDDILFEILAMVRQDDGEEGVLALTFAAATNVPGRLSSRAYAVQAKSHLAYQADWDVLIGNIAPTGATMRVEFSDPAPPPRFYRLRVRLP